LALVAVSGAIGYMICARSRTYSRFNNMIKVTNRKVTDVIDIEDIGDKKAYCRCWKSKTWPYCDGAHSKHNRETGENRGPIVVKRTK
ncbi:hypothetical protein PENTCL1PPCAC_14425, partial [Pristionchus entomophagus]